MTTLKNFIYNKFITGFFPDIIDLSTYNTFQCKSCMKGKTSKKRQLVGHRVKYQKEYEAFECIHSDIFGPLPNLSSSTPKYFISSLINFFFTRLRWVFLLHSKKVNTVTRIFYKFIKMVKTHFGSRTHAFGLDRDSEYTTLLSGMFLIVRVFDLSTPFLVFLLRMVLRNVEISPF